MQSRIPFHRPALSDKERTYVLAALEGRWWGGGAFVERLERALEETWGRPAVAVSSGTAALEIALRVLLDEEGGEVILPVWTFTATAAAVWHAGGEPILVDVGPTLHIQPEAIQAAITPRTRGVIAVHYAGMAANMKALQEICQRHGLWLLEDACHAQPGYWEGQLCGTFGKAATLSFHATKPIAAGQGGAILFQDTALAEKAQLWRRHGIVRDKSRYWDYEVHLLGYNYQMPELSAALALAQVELMTERWHSRQKIAALYQEILGNSEHLKLYAAKAEECGWHLFPIFLQQGEGLRDKVLQRMGEKGYPLNLHYRPLHRHRAYRRWAEGRAFPVADAAYERLITLPIWPEMTPEETALVAQTLLESIAEVEKERGSGEVSPELKAS